MFNTGEFSLHIKQNHGKNFVFILNDHIQKLINDNDFCSCENIEQIVMKVMGKEFYVELASSYTDYNISYQLFSTSFLNCNYTVFNYFFCNLTAAHSRAIVIFPIKHKDLFCQKLLKINKMKPFT